MSQPLTGRCRSCRHWQADEPPTRKAHPEDPRRRCARLSGSRDREQLLVVPLELGTGPRIAVYTAPGWGCADFDPGEGR